VASNNELPSLEPYADVAPARHSGTILAELDDDPLTLPHPPVEPPPAPQEEISNLGLALKDIGLPSPACQALPPTTARDSLEAELCRVLDHVLPRLPAVPSAASSVVAVVGPRTQVMVTARALAAEIGTPADEIALATERNVWRSQAMVLHSPEVASEERRSWRWRGHPSVVAIEAPVRPSGADWANAMLHALKPTLCWGVAEASRKPEDLRAWSEALGGLDLLALVDLEGTTTPASALSAPVPVGRLDGEPATAELWAKLLCSRITG
jgi:hypothetical protein